jgi:hypothetical protein
MIRARLTTPLEVAVIDNLKILKWGMMRTGTSVNLCKKIAYDETSVRGTGS